MPGRPLRYNCDDIPEPDIHRRSAHHNPVGPGFNHWQIAGAGSFQFFCPVIKSVGFFINVFLILPVEAFQFLHGPGKRRQQAADI